MNLKLKIFSLFVVLVGASTVQASPLTTTTAGSNLGFTLSTFVSGFPNNGTFGPMGIVSTSAGNILVTDYGGTPQRNVYSFNDFPDGQTPADALTVTPGAGRGMFGITNAGGEIFAIDYANNQIDKLNDDGTFNSVFLPSAFFAKGITTNPVNQNLYVTTPFDIKEIDRASAGVRTVTAAIGSDGIAVSPDGTLVYVAIAGGISGYDTATGALVFSPLLIPGADGVAVIQGFTPLAGQLIVNSNDGSVTLVDTLSRATTLIASGGTRGDFVGYDLLTGSLFLSQLDSVERLTCPGCIFTTVPIDSSPVPEPFSLTLIGLGLAGLEFVRRKHA